MLKSVFSSSEIWAELQRNVFVICSAKHVFGWGNPLAWHPLLRRMFSLRLPDYRERLELNDPGLALQRLLAAWWLYFSLQQKMYQGYLGYFAVCFFFKHVVEHIYLVQPVLVFCSRGCKLCIEEGISTLNTRHADVSYVEIRASPLNTYRFAPRFGLHLALVGLCGPISISRVWPGHELWFVRPISLSSENGFVSD